MPYWSFIFPTNSRFWLGIHQIIVIIIFFFIYFCSPLFNIISTHFNFYNNLIKILHRNIINKKIVSTFRKYYFFWCPKWDSNPHGFPHDFESCASASSAIRAHNIYKNFTYFIYISINFKFCLVSKCIFYWLNGKIKVWYIILYYRKEE